MLFPQPGDFFQGTRERVRNSHGKQAISVQATEELLYIVNTLYHGCSKITQLYSHKITVHLLLVIIIINCIIIRIFFM